MGMALGKSDSNAWESAPDCLSSEEGLIWSAIWDLASQLNGRTFLQDYSAVQIFIHFSLYFVMSLYHGLRFNCFIFTVLELKIKCKYVFKHDRFLSTLKIHPHLLFPNNDFFMFCNVLSSHHNKNRVII